MLNISSLEYLTKKFAYGFDRMLLQTALCPVLSETDGSKWSQSPTLDISTEVLAFPLLRNSNGNRTNLF